MCPIDVYYQVEAPGFDRKKLLVTLNPGDDGYGLRDPLTGENMVIVCGPDDKSGAIMRRQPQKQDDIQIVSIDAQGVPIERVNIRDLSLVDTIPPNGTQEFRMLNAAGNTCLITCTHRYPR